MTAATSYDEIPYHSYPFPQTLPERLATIGTLFGMQPKGIHACRVLELGCAGGGNLIPMAERYPGAEFIGIDASIREIEQGQDAIAKTGLKNISLLHKNILEAGSELGAFDYIIVHGVYSWVPAEVQDKILLLCQELLSPQGIAYISYNTFPGWHMRGMIRDVMCYRAKFFSTPQDKLHEARELVNFLAGSVPQEGNPYGTLLNSELSLLQNKEDYYLFHEFLEEFNQPCYFHEFMQRASTKNLQYLGEADFSMMSASNLSREVTAHLQQISSDIVQMEQYMDFVRNRMFRQTLLCHSSIPLERRPHPEKLFNLYFATNSMPDGEVGDLRSRERVTYRRPGSTLTSSEPLVKSAMAVLREEWPQSVHFAELLAKSRAKLYPEPLVIESDRDSRDAILLAEPLLRCFATTHIDVSASRLAPLLTVPEFPQVTSYARLQAQLSGHVTNLWHQSISVNDLQKQILLHLDGTVNREELLDRIVQTILEQKLSVHFKGSPVRDEETLRNIVGPLVEANLELLAKQGMFLTPA